MLAAKLDGEIIIVSERHWAEQESFLRTASREGRLLAPCCGAPLVLRWGQRKVRHFAHPPNQHCPYDRWAEPESPEHAAGKMLLYEWCRQAFGPRIRLLALEHPLAETLQRPDVYLELTDGSRYAFEYQRSVITAGEWAERHAGYQQLGIHDIWILGENRLADALPTPDQQARWGAREPHMHFLKLRAFEAEAAVRTPYEIAWWRGAQQEQLWAPQELDARVGREVFPWYKRSALDRLRSVTFLDAGSGEVHIYRAMRELPGHTDVKMASTVQRLALGAPDPGLSPAGFATAADRERLAAFEQRAARLEAVARQPAAVAASAGMVAEPFTAYTIAGHRVQDRTMRTWPEGVDPTLFLPSDQEAEQRRRLQDRSAVPEWRKTVDRNGLKPENLHFMIGIPIPDDTIFLVHRTVWQAYLYYWLIGRLRGSLAAPRVAQLLGRKFGIHEEMSRVARFLLPGEVSTPEEVVGRFLNLMVGAGYLRNDMGSEQFRYHAVPNPPPPLAFVDRTQRHKAWTGLLDGRLRLQGHTLIGTDGPIPLAPSNLTC